MNEILNFYEWYVKYHTQHICGEYTLEGCYQCSYNDEIRIFTRLYLRWRSKGSPDLNTYEEEWESSDKELGIDVPEFK